MWYPVQQALVIALCLLSAGPAFSREARRREHGSDVLDLHAPAALPVCCTLLLPQVERDVGVKEHADVAALMHSIDPSKLGNRAHPEI
jgi:hypothetical protein